MSSTPPPAAVAELAARVLELASLNERERLVFELLSSIRLDQVERLLEVLDQEQSSAFCEIFLAYYELAKAEPAGRSYPNEVPS